VPPRPVPGRARSPTATARRGIERVLLVVAPPGRLRLTRAARDDAIGMSGPPPAVRLVRSASTRAATATAAARRAPGFGRRDGPATLFQNARVAFFFPRPYGLQVYLQRDDEAVDLHVLCRLRPRVVCCTCFSWPRAIPPRRLLTGDQSGPAAEGGGGRRGEEKVGTGVAAGHGCGRTGRVRASCGSLERHRRRRPATLSVRKHYPMPPELSSVTVLSDTRGGSIRKWPRLFRKGIRNEEHMGSMMYTAHIAVEFLCSVSLAGEKTYMHAH
jgi:hypothetical protein